MTIPTSTLKATLAPGQGFCELRRYPPQKTPQCCPKMTSGSAVSLRVMGDGFDPRKLKELFGVRPTSIRVVGEKWAGKSGREYGTASCNVWSYRVEAPSEMGFDEQIRLLLAEIQPHQDALRILSATDDVETELFCGFSSGNGQGGDVISNEVLGQLASLGLSLSLDLFPPDIDEISQDKQGKQPGAAPNP